MTEQPAPYRPNPTLKRVERGFESLLFNSRWLMAPFYFGLVVSLAVLMLKFCMILWEFIIHAPGSKESDIILGVLSLIDVSLTGNLILIVVFSGYENFVSKIDPGGHPDWPDWMTKIHFGGLKQKLLASIVAISAIQVLEGVHEHRRRRSTPRNWAGWSACIWCSSSRPSCWRCPTAGAAATTAASRNSDSIRRHHYRRLPALPACCEIPSRPDRARTASPRRRRNRRRAGPFRRFCTRSRTNGNVIRFSRTAEHRGLLDPDGEILHRLVVALLDHLAGLDEHLHPLADEVARRQRLDLVDEGADAAALGVTEHHDVLHLQHVDRIFQRRRDAVRAAVGLIDRHQIGDVAHHEQFAGAGVEDHLRRDAGIAAADHHHRGRLAALGQFAVARLLGRQPLRGEGPVAVEQMLRERVPWPLPNHMPVTRNKAFGPPAEMISRGVQNHSRGTRP